MCIPTICQQAAIAVLLVIASCVSPAGAADRPNILFLLADDQRPDTIASLGNQHIRTPNLDSLVRDGTTFLRATCSNPICVISRAEILTGQLGWQNGIDGLKGRTFKQGVTFWPQTLKNAGYETRYVGKWHTTGRPGKIGYQTTNGLFSGGGGSLWREGQTDWKGFPISGYRGWLFQTSDGRTKFPERGIGLTSNISKSFADATIELLGQTTDKPWFMHVNFTAPHDPLIMPPNYEGGYSADEMPLPKNFLSEHPFDHGNLKGRDETLMHWPRTPEAVRDVLRVYYSVIDDLDHQVGRILKTLQETGQAENTIVIYASDHGMAVGSHGLRGKQNMYEHTINVPLIIRGPGITANRKTKTQVYLRDLYPTTCELIGIKPPEAVTAQSFADQLTRKPNTPERDRVFGYFTDTQRMVRSGTWKLIRYPKVDRWQLFDLKSDPYELNNLADIPQHAERFASLRKELSTWRQQMNDPVVAE